LVILSMIQGADSRRQRSREIRVRRKLFANDRAQRGEIGTREAHRASS